MSGGFELAISHDKTGNDQKVKGSDNRLNVSSRSDSRAYYASRDDSSVFSLIWQDASSEAGQFVAYWKNDDTTGRSLVVRNVGLNSENDSTFKLHRVTGTASGGTASAPACENQQTPKIAPATAMTQLTGTITGLNIETTHDVANVKAGSHEEFRTGDLIRLGQGQACAIEYDDGTTGKTNGVIVCFYE